MDLELTDEQRWLSESIDTLLAREWLPADALAEATVERRRRVWDQLLAIGALSIGGDGGIGAVEACLIARSLGAHLASAPFIASAATRLALGPLANATPSGLLGDAAVALALLEPGSGWSPSRPDTTLERHGDAFALAGKKVAIEQADLSQQLAVVCALDADLAVALVPASARRVELEARHSFDETLPMAAGEFEQTRVGEAAVVAGAGSRAVLERLTSAGALLAAAEAVGAAGRALDEACRYAAQRRQFGRAIGSFQSLRHLLADMYVRAAGGWSAVLYAAAAFDEGADEASQAASIAKAYVSRGMREIAHGAMQVFGGIAFTAEHPAHRYLRRIVFREQQFGDAAHHERALGRALARGRNRAQTASVRGAGA